MSLAHQALVSGKATQSTAADNAVATATVAAITTQTHRITGVHAEYDAAVSAFKVITIIQGSTTLLTLNHDFTNGEFAFSFPSYLAGVQGGAVSATLGASGTGGTSGRVTLFTFAN